MNRLWGIRYGWHKRFIVRPMMRILGYWNEAELEPQSVSKDVVSTLIGKLGLSLEEADTIDGIEVRVQNMTDF